MAEEKKKVGRKAKPRNGLKKRSTKTYSRTRDVEAKYKVVEGLPDQRLLYAAIKLRRAIEAIKADLPPKMRDFDKPARYKAAYGGRGSSKSHSFASLLVLRCLTNPGTRAVCIREVQKSIALSVRQLIVDKIKKYGVEDYFEIQEQKIITPAKGVIIFQGMQNHTSDSIKSLEGFDIAWVEEAQSISEKSLRLLRPTIRKDLHENDYVKSYNTESVSRQGSELWFSWNPDAPTDPIDEFLRGGKPPADIMMVRMNYEDNPYFPSVLRDEMEYDKARDFEKYLHVWEGEYQRNSEARVFKNFSQEEFETPEDARFFFGADWGFAKDPSVIVRCFFGYKDRHDKVVADPEGKTLFVDYEAWKVGCSIEKTPELFMTVPEADKWPIRADSARPETIDYMQRHGFPKMERAAKGKNSVNDGIEFIKNYDVVIHPRCDNTYEEFVHYRYKIDPKTEEILPVLEDKNNHCIDALRYALEHIRKVTKRKKKASFFGVRFIR
jgi:phage terminase large subunit